MYETYYAPYPPAIKLQQIYQSHISLWWYHEIYIAGSNAGTQRSSESQSSYHSTLQDGVNDIHPKDSLLRISGTYNRGHTGLIHIVAPLVLCLILLSYQSTNSNS